MPARRPRIAIAIVQVWRPHAWSRGPIRVAIRVVPWLMVALALSAAGLARPELVLLVGLVAALARSPEEDLNAKKP